MQEAFKKEIKDAMKETIKGTSFTEYEGMIKLLILSYSLRLESMISDYLRYILKLNSSPISLGNTSNALSMNQKVTLMIDSGLFKSSDKKSIVHFQAIRNQFMHNIEAKSLESCMSFLNGTEGYINKLFLKEREVAEREVGETLIKDNEAVKTNNKELEKYGVSDKEKMLYNCLLVLLSDVLNSYREALNRLTGKDN